MKSSLQFISTIFLLSTGACASIIDGHSQPVAVNTTPPNADCSLNRQGAVIGRVDQTPGSTTVDKTREDINITCNKKGYQETSFIDKSGVDGWVFGNIIFGGLIGWGIDAATGAYNEYDSPVNMTLPKK